MGENEKGAIRRKVGQIGFMVQYRMPARAIIRQPVADARGGAGILARLVQGQHHGFVPSIPLLEGSGFGFIDRLQRGRLGRGQRSGPGGSRECGGRDRGGDGLWRLPVPSGGPGRRHWLLRDLPQLAVIVDQVGLPRGRRRPRAKRQRMPMACFVQTLAGPDQNVQPPECRGDIRPHRRGAPGADPATD